MAIDAYVKFGTTGEKIGPHDSDRPKIDGDSTDADHYWWCELRDCGFELENVYHPTTDEDNDEETEAHFKPVTLKKRVDWATTQLFVKCCQAAEASSKKEDEGDHILDEVEIHVCRPSGGWMKDNIERAKVPVVIVWYYKVRITHFRIDISEPEPSEEISFEFESLKYAYQETDPYTGLPVGKAEDHKTADLKNYVNKTTPAGASAPTAAAAGNGSGSSTTVVPGVPAAGANGGGGSSSSLATVTDMGVATNFPGLFPQNGQGTLS